MFEHASNTLVVSACQELYLVCRYHAVDCVVIVVRVFMTSASMNKDVSFNQ